VSDGTQFPHEKLTVYHKALEFFERIQRHLSTWSRQHAFVDHLWRASESVVFNLVEAVRLRQTEKKTLAVDYAIGSVMECAACLDIAVLKRLIEKAVANELKSVLLEVCKMSVGLRNSWTASRTSAKRTPSSTLPSTARRLACRRIGRFGPCSHNRPNILWNPLQE